MYKTKWLKIMICLVLIVSAFCFSACSSVNLTTVVNEDGTIDEIVCIVLDKQDLKEQGYTDLQISEIEQDIKQIGAEKAQNIVYQFNSKVGQDALVAESQIEKQKILSKANGISALLDDDAESFSFILRFRSADVYRYYYNITDTAEIQYLKDKHFLYTRYYYYASTMYYDYSSLYDSIKLSLQVKYPSLVANNMSKLSYTYQTDARREHSNADYIAKKNGVYYHTWIVSENEFEKPIMIYYNIANSGNWILICIGISVVLAIILSCIAWLVNLKKKQNTT